MNPHVRRSRELQAEYADQYVLVGTRSWFLFIVATLVSTLLGNAGKSEPMHLLALSFFGTLFLLFNAFNVKRVLGRAWEKEQLTPPLRAFLLVYFSAIAANWITMLVFWRSYSHGEGVNALVVPLYVSAGAWGIWLFWFKKRLRSRLGRLLVSEFTPMTSREKVEPLHQTELVLVPAKRWHYLTVASVAAIITGFTFMSVSPSLLGFPGVTLVLAGLMGVVARMIRNLTWLAVRRKTEMPVNLTLGQAAQGVLPIALSIRARPQGEVSVSLELLLARVLPGAYENEWEQLASVPAVGLMVPREEGRTEAVLAVALPEVPPSVEDTQGLRYVLRLLVQTQGNEWISKRSVVLGHLPVAAGR